MLNVLCSRQSSPKGLPKLTKSTDNTNPSMFQQCNILHFSVFNPLLIVIWFYFPWLFLIRSYTLMTSCWQKVKSWLRLYSLLSLTLSPVLFNLKREVSFLQRVWNEFVSQTSVSTFSLQAASLFLTAPSVLCLFFRPTLLREQHYQYLKKGLRHLSDAYEVQYPTGRNLFHGHLKCAINPVTRRARPPTSTRALLWFLRVSERSNALWT